MDYEHDDRRATDHRGIPDADRGRDLPAEVDDLASALMPGGLLPPVLADVDRDLGFPPPQTPDLASAFLAALDAVDDQRFVTPPDARALDRAHDQKPEEHEERVESVTPPVAGLLTMGDRAPDAARDTAHDAGHEVMDAPIGDVKPPLVRVFDASAIDTPSIDTPSIETASIETSWAETPWGGTEIESTSIPESAESQDPAEEPPPMTVAEWAAAFEVVEPNASAAGAFENGAPLDMTVEQDAHEADLPFGDALEVQDSIPFEDLGVVQPPVVLGDATTFEGPVSIEMPVALEPVGAESEIVADGEPEPDVLEDLQEFVVFSLGDLRCVVPIRNVVEVGRIPDSAPVPNAPPWLYGLGNLRGQVMTLIDLRAFFGVGRIKAATGRMVVLRADADEVTAAVMVDQVHQIVSLSPSRFREAPATLPQRSTEFVWGACDYGNYTMIGLDVDGVLGVENAAEDAAV